MSAANANRKVSYWKADEINVRGSNGMAMEIGWTRVTVNC
jgi:hypothetical protein